MGGPFKGEDSDVTKEPQLQLQHMLGEKFQPSGQSLFIARRKQSNVPLGMCCSKCNREREDGGLLNCY